MADRVTAADLQRRRAGCRERESVVAMAVVLDNIEPPFSRCRDRDGRSNGRVSRDLIYSKPSSSPWWAHRRRGWAKRQFLGRGGPGGARSRPGPKKESPGDLVQSQSRGEVAALAICSCADPGLLAAVCRPLPPRAALTLHKTLQFSLFLTHIRPVNDLLLISDPPAVTPRQSDFDTRNPGNRLDPPTLPVPYRRD